jgi:cyanoexosortase A
MKSAEFYQRLNTPFYRLLGGATALMLLYLTLVARAGDTAHWGMSLLFIWAAGMLLWEKRHLQFGAGWMARLTGAGLIGWVLWKSYFIHADEYQTTLRLLPLISALGLGLVASGFKGLQQYRQEFTILLFLGVPSILAQFIADISPLTAAFSATLLWLTGFAVTTTQDVYINLPGGSVQVYEGCSGIESITYLLGISVVCLNLFPIARMKQILLIGLAVLIGFVVNGVRVALMAVLFAAQQQAAFDYWHEGDGSLIFGVAAIAVFALIFHLLTRTPAAE